MCVPRSPCRAKLTKREPCEQDILLGRANAQAGVLKIPVAYFVLTRAAADCGCESCRSCGQASGEFGVGVSNIEAFDNEHGRAIVAPVKPGEGSFQSLQDRDVVDMPNEPANSAASHSTKSAANGNSKDATVDEQPSDSDQQPTSKAPVTEPAAPVAPAKSDAASPTAKPNEDAAAEREATNKSPAVPAEPRIESNRIGSRAQTDRTVVGEVNEKPKSVSRYTASV